MKYTMLQDMEFLWSPSIAIQVFRALRECFLCIIYIVDGFS